MDSIAAGTQFTAIEDFYSKDLNSQYCAGLSYTVRDGDTNLSALITGWVKENKVMLGGISSKVEGRG